MSSTGGVIPCYEKYIHVFIFVYDVLLIAIFNFEFMRRDFVFILIFLSVVAIWSVSLFVPYSPLARL